MEKKEETGYSFFDLRVLESQRETTVEIERVEGDKESGVAKFKLRALTPAEQISVDVAVGHTLMGANRLSVDDGAIYAIERSATLRKAIVEHPAWWDGPDRCPSENFLTRLYGKYVEHSNNFQEELKKNKPFV